MRVLLVLVKPSGSLATGIYALCPYANTLHSVALLPSADTLKETFLHTLEEETLSTAAAILILAANYDHKHYKYGDLGYRLAQIETGCALQNALLSITDLKAAGYPHAGFDQERLSRLCGLDLEFSDDVLDLLVSALRQSHHDEKLEHEAAIDRLQAEYDRLQQRLHAMYIDKLDGRVEAGFFQEMSDKWRSEQNRLLHEIHRHQEGDRDYLEDGVQLLQLAQSAGRLFAKQDAHEQRRLLNFVLSNSSWKSGQIAASFRQPFNMIAQTVAIARRGDASQGAEISSRQSWLGD